MIKKGILSSLMRLLIVLILIINILLSSCNTKKSELKGDKQDSIYLFNNTEKGLADGEFKRYYKSGALKEIENIIDGKRKGKYIQYYENGKIAIYSFYENGLPIYIKHFNKNGILMRSAVGFEAPVETYNNKIDTNDSLLIKYSFLHTMNTGVYMYLEAIRITDENRKDTILKIGSDTTFIDYYLKNLREGEYLLQVDIYEVLKQNDSIVGSAIDTLKFKVTPVPTSLPLSNSGNEGNPGK